MSSPLSPPAPGTANNSAAKPAKYNITSDDGDASSITVFIPGENLPLVATAQHKNFEKIVEACKLAAPIDQIRELFNLGYGMVRQFNKVTDRVSMAGGQLFFDADPVDDAIATVIIAFAAEGNENFMPLVKFYEKLQQNPNEHSRKMLYQWMTTGRSFGIMPDGDLVAYKGVTRTGDREDLFRSTASGRAIVNGELHSGRIPTSPGVVVEMPRSEVNHNPREGCSTGLHAGTFDYAKGYGNTLLRVKINPRDVVSVPTDCNAAKMRVCRYRVLGPVQNPQDGEPEGLFHPTDELRTLAMEAVEPEAVVESRMEKKKGKKARAGRVAASAKKKIAKMKEQKFPKFYEDFTLAHFRKIDYKRLRWLAKEWEVKAGSNPKHEELAKALSKAASEKRREAKKYDSLDTKGKRQMTREGNKPTTTKVDA